MYHSCAIVHLTLIFHISLHFSFQNGSSNNFVEFKFPSFPWHFLDYQYIQRTVDIMQSRSKDYDSCFTISNILKISSPTNLIYLNIFDSATQTLSTSKVKFVLLSFGFQLKVCIVALQSRFECKSFKKVFALHVSEHV